LTFSFSIRPVSDKYADAIAMLYEEVYGGNYPITDFKDPGAVRKLICSERCIWYVAFASNRLIGSMAGESEPWNKSLEIGRGVVHMDYRNKHVAYRLFESIMSNDSESDIQWGYIRNEPLARSILHGKDEGPMFLDAGFVPGKFRVVDRENHLIKIRIKEDAARRRLGPGEQVRKELPFIGMAESLFGLNETMGEYPDAVFVGPDRGEVLDTVSGKILYETLPDNSFVLNGLDGGTGAIMDFLATNPEAEYVEVNILADKIDAAADLMSMGFEMCCYIPGWADIDGKRLDCIKMTRHANSVSHDEYVEQTIKDFRKRFSVSQEKAHSSYNTR
jgi:hypothetical protein